MLKAISFSICAALLVRGTCYAAEAADNAASSPAISDATAAAITPPDFESLRIKGLNLPLPGPQDTIDPDFAGMRSRLAAIGIGYLGYSNNSFFDNVLSAERKTFGQQAYNGEKSTFLSNNVMQLTFDLDRHGIPDGQIVVGGIYQRATWNPGGPNALSFATLSYYQTFLNERVELKFGYLNNAFEFWGPYLSGNLSSSIFGPSGAIPIETGMNAYGFTTPAINIKVNGPDGLYDKASVQRAASPDGPVAEKAANPTGLNWSTPNSGALVINEFGYRKGSAPGQAATWLRAAPLFNTSRYVDYEFGGRRTGDYAAYFLADHQFVQLGQAPDQAATGVYAGATAMYAPPEFNRFSQYYELRLYGIGLFPSRPSDMLSLVTVRNVFSHYLVDTALRQNQLAYSNSSSITVAYTAKIVPGIQLGIGLGYTDHPTPVVYTPRTGSDLNILANIITFW